ncbi:MAG: DUF1512 family protein, partial [Candidatus Methylarchaceae archaeon HK01M]|nr:DUF1512 family protein [Candidatus Methylarchaceae archaeon HK01M]
MLESLQIPGLGDSSLLGLLIFWIPFIIIMLYGQRIQMYISLGEISRSLNKLKLMKEKSREEVIDFVSKISQSKDKLTEKIDQFLEYFTIQPISLDPAG